MTDDKNETALTVRTDNAALRNKTSQVSAIQRADAGAADYVPHITAGQVKLMAVVAGQNGLGNVGEPDICCGMLIPACAIGTANNGWAKNTGRFSRLSELVLLPPNKGTILLRLYTGEIARRKAAREL